MDTYTIFETIGGGDIKWKDKLEVMATAWDMVVIHLTAWDMAVTRTTITDVVEITEMILASLIK